MSTATFGVIGLGVMGENLALNLMEHGTTVAVWNLETEWTERFVAAHPSAVGARTLEEFVGALARPRRMLMMIKAGAPVDGMMEKLRPLLEPGDIVVDGGNSWFKDTQRREAAWRALGLHFVGMGVSGGAEGARRGPSMMPGGSRAAWAELRPALESIAARSRHGACVAYVGPDGAGHFVKMVHNGIEYGDMQILAEGYDLMRKVLGMSAAQIADTFAAWNERDPSFLLELAARVLRRRDEKTGAPLVDEVLDVAGQKGTGKWSAQVAFDLAVPLPTINAAVDARLISALKPERVAAARVLAGPSLRGALDLEALRAAITFAKITSYAQGMALIAAGSREYKWDVDLAEMARIWTAGCIIRARLLEDIMRAFGRRRDLANLMLDEDLARLLVETQPAMRAVVGVAHARGVPVPALDAALGYFDAYRSAELPHNLTQAQRDAFGAHTYQRNDVENPPFVHTDW